MSASAAISNSLPSTEAYTSTPSPRQKVAEPSRDDVPNRLRYLELRSSRLPPEHLRRSAAAPPHRRKADCRRCGRATSPRGPPTQAVGAFCSTYSATSPGSRPVKREPRGPWARATGRPAVREKSLRRNRVDIPVCPDDQHPRGCESRTRNRSRRSELASAAWRSSRNSTNVCSADAFRRNCQIESKRRNRPLSGSPGRASGRSGRRSASSGRI